MKRTSLAVHSDSAPPVPMPKKRKIQSHPRPLTRFRPGHMIHEDDNFTFEFIYNDQSEAHWIALCDLKQIFAACLPRMGSRYVTRHVFDEHHRLLCCRSKSKSTTGSMPHTSKLLENFPVDRPIIGGICIRPFYEQKFGEVVFLAVHNQYQHKSVGRKIMRVMKAAAVAEGLSHFYTYADNQAIGFFQKMGFSAKKSQMGGNEAFWNYIKHYTGSELMECRLYDKVDYVHLDDHLARFERDILMQCHQYRQGHCAKDMDTVHEAPKSFLIPISKLIVILELEDDFEKDDEEELLLDMLKHFGIENDRDLYDVYCSQTARGREVGSLPVILTGLFGAKRGANIHRKIELYLTRPNDKMVFDHIDVLETIEGVKGEWFVDTVRPAKDEQNKRRSSRFSAYYLKASYILKRLRKHEVMCILKDSYFCMLVHFALIPSSIPY